MASSVLTNFIPGMLAGSSFASAQYKVVKFASTAGQVVPVTATTDNGIGIIQNDPATGQEALIAGPGSVAKAIAGASDIAAGELLGFNTTGQVADHTTAGRWTIAMALQASTAVGDYISVLVLPRQGYA